MGGGCTKKVDAEHCGKRGGMGHQGEGEGEEWRGALEEERQQQ